jgi:hypothetical protein
MDFLTGADPKIVFAFWLGVVVACMAVVMLVVILAMRQAMLRKERNHARAAALWRRLLVDAVHGPQVAVPALPRRDISGFVDAWNHVHGTLADGHDAPLQRIAGEVGLERHLTLSLDHGGFHNRVMALIAIGYLRSRVNFDKVARYLDDRSSIVSLSAARALMRMEPQRAVALFVPHIVTRPDWSQSGVVEILRQAGPSNVSRELGEVALRANADVAPRLVRFLADVSPEEAAPVIRRILESSTDEHLISTCLQVMTEPADLDLVRPLLARERWHVRMHAAAAIGRLGHQGDIQLLLPLLADTQWWVRYRAGQALAKLPGMHDEDLARIRANQSDRFACDILDQVLAERKMGVQR